MKAVERLEAIAALVYLGFYLLGAALHTAHWRPLYSLMRWFGFSPAVAPCTMLCAGLTLELIVCHFATQRTADVKRRLHSCCCCFGFATGAFLADLVGGWAFGVLFAFLALHRLRGSVRKICHAE